MRRALWVVACAAVAVGVLGGVVPGSDACAWAASGQAIELVGACHAPATSPIPRFLSIPAASTGTCHVCIRTTSSAAGKAVEDSPTPG